MRPVEKQHKWAMTCDFQQCCILTWIDSDEPVQLLFKLRKYKWCSVSNLIFQECLSHSQRLWLDCTYAQADLSLCWSHIPHCWKSCVAAQFNNANFWLIKVPYPLLRNIKGYVQGILPQLSIHTNNVHICRNWLLWWWWWVIWVPVRISIGVIKRLTPVWITSVRKWNGIQTRGPSCPE